MAPACAILTAYIQCLGRPEAGYFPARPGGGGPPCRRPCCGAQSRNSDARHFYRDLRKPAARPDARRPAAARGRACASASTGRAACRRGRARRLPGAARRQAGAHAGAPRAGRARRARWPRRWRAEWNAQSDDDRSGAHAADAAGQCGDRRGGRCARSRSPPKSQNISAAICCAIAPRRRTAWSRGRRKPGTRCWPGRARRSARASCRSQGVVHRRAAGARRSPPRARAIPAEPWRLGAVSSITTLTGSALLALALADRRARRRGGLGRRPCRRGLADGAVGPRRDRARAPRFPLRRDAGGGDGAAATSEGIGSERSWQRRPVDALPDPRLQRGRAAQLVTARSGRRGGWPRRGTRRAFRPRRYSTSSRLVVATSSCSSQTSCASRMAVTKRWLSSRSSASMSSGRRKAASLSAMRCWREMSPIERSVLPPILRTRSASTSVMAKIWSACSSSRRW